MTKKNYLTFIYQVEFNCYLLWNFNDKVNFLSPEAFCQRKILCFSVSRCLMLLAFVQYFRNILEQSEVTSLFHKWVPGSGKALAVPRSCKVSFPSGNAVQICLCPFLLHILEGTQGDCWGNQPCSTVRAGWVQSLESSPPPVQVPISQEAHPVPYLSISPHKEHPLSGISLSAAS